MPATESRHLSSQESMKVNGPADVKIKRGGGGNLGEMDKEGLQDKVSGTWETLQTQGGKILNDVTNKGNELLGTVKESVQPVLDKGNELRNRGGKVVGDLGEKLNLNKQQKSAGEEDEGEWNEVSYGKKKNKVKGELKSSLNEAKGKLNDLQVPSMNEAKNKFKTLIDRQQWSMGDILSLLVPLLILALALTAGIAAYRAYTAPPPLPPWNSLDGMKARAGLYSSEAKDYMLDHVDYATDRASLLAEQLKDKAGIYADSAKAQLWKSKDLAAEQANLAYKEALKKAAEAKKLADLKSKEALNDLRSYAKHQTKPEGLMDKLGYKLNEIKENIAQKTGLMSENAKHKSALAAEEARHKAAEAKLKATHNGLGDKIKESVHDLKESVKAKIHPHI